MQKLKAFFQNLNYAVMGFIAFSVRLAIFGATLADALAIFAFAGLYGFQIYLKHQDVKKYNEKFEADVKIEFQKAAEEIAKVKTAVSGMTLGNSMRGIGGQR